MQSNDDYRFIYHGRVSSVKEKSSGWSYDVDFDGNSGICTKTINYTEKELSKIIAASVQGIEGKNFFQKWVWRCIVVCMDNF